MTWVDENKSVFSRSFENRKENWRKCLQIFMWGFWNWYCRSWKTNSVRRHEYCETTIIKVVYSKLPFKSLDSKTKKFLRFPGTQRHIKVSKKGFFSWNMSIIHKRSLLRQTTHQIWVPYENLYQSYVNLYYTGQTKLFFSILIETKWDIHKRFSLFFTLASTCGSFFILSVTI